MTILVLYVATLAVFLVIDIIGLTQILRPIFERHVGDILADPFRLGPAAMFYAAYIAGVLYFVSWPALSDGKPLNALIGGALLGLMCYGTFEFTNLAVIRGWSWQQVIVDTAWGGFLTGFSAWAGVTITRALT